MNASEQADGSFDQPRGGRFGGRRGRGRDFRGRGRSEFQGGRGPREEFLPPEQRQPMMGGHDDRMGEGTDRAEGDRRGGRGGRRGGRGGGRGRGGFPEGPGSRRMPPGEEPKWEYLDPQGGVRGPWSSRAMLGWQRAGYFNDQLPTRVITASDSEFRTLKMCIANMRADCGEKAPAPQPVEEPQYVPVQGHPAQALASAEPSSSSYEEARPGRGRGRGPGGPGFMGPGGPAGKPFLSPADYGSAVANRLFTADSRMGSEEPVWRYIDLKGEIQGPFPANQMLGWFERGYLDTLELPMCGTERKVSPPDLPDPQIHYQRFGNLLDMVNQGVKFIPLTPKHIEEKTLPVYGPPRGGGGGGGRGGGRGEPGGRRGGRGGRGRGPPGGPGRGPPEQHLAPEPPIQQEYVIVPSVHGRGEGRGDGDRFAGRGGRGRRGRGRGRDAGPMGGQGDSTDRSIVPVSGVTDLPPDEPLSGRGRGERGRGRRGRGRGGRMTDAPGGPEGPAAGRGLEEGQLEERRRGGREGRGEGRGRGRGGRGRDGGRGGRGRGRKVIDVELKTLEDGLVKLTISPSKRPERPDRPGRGRGRNSDSRNWNESKDSAPGAAAEPAAGPGAGWEAGSTSGPAWAGDSAAADAPVAVQKQEVPDHTAPALTDAEQKQAENIALETKGAETAAQSASIETATRTLPGKMEVESLPGKMTLESGEAEQKLPGKMTLESSTLGNKASLDPSAAVSLPGKMTLEAQENSTSTAAPISDLAPSSDIDSKHAGVTGDIGEADSLKLAKAAEKDDGLASLDPVQKMDTPADLSKSLPPLEQSDTKPQAAVEFESDTPSQQQTSTETSAVYHSEKGQEGGGIQSQETKSTQSSHQESSSLLDNIKGSVTNLVETAKEKTESLTSPQAHTEERAIGKPTSKALHVAHAEILDKPTSQQSSEATDVSQAGKDAQQGDEKGKSGKKGFLQNLFGKSSS